ncbi:3-oxoacyl-[acyl-carrier-protein] synthase 2 [Reticulibacter mediterranei]|uniref:3-oxoacyl-[acyl-carrier-protein] synthase 2 n=1 Tax=Reticulibacter mediterranei TaxID=2778369 RepID=A0A8J3IJE1_9CHLR|nr:beta-ketoacyl-[acyl-carrier-protein] synthase family protein [Reticulibacter mediterranei]GHO94773.1 3-oxoacyl-[acyl-carrier-protein] synthase 2 [Reticulibacter mediterranei]
MRDSKRVVITGLGVVAANGIGKEAYWQAVSQGTPAITPLSSPHNASSWVAGAVNDFITEEHIDRKMVNRSARMTHFVLAAIQEAMFDAQIDMVQEQPQRVGAVIANTLGGMDYVLKQLQTLYTRGPRFVSAYTAIAWLNVTNVGQAAIRYGIQGYCKVPMNDTAGGLNALGMAYQAIQRGVADVIITGGCEAFLDPLILQVMARQGVGMLTDDPHAYRPFDRRAAGLILAEGAGICILESYEHARKRGVPIYGEIVGYGQAHEANGLVAPSSNGTYYACAIEMALAEAQTQAEDIAYFSLDGRALPSADEGEARALHQVFGSQLSQVPVSVPRTMIGHSYAAAGAIDAITALLALKHGVVPPTLNCEEQEPAYELPIISRQAQPFARHEPDTVLLGGRGIGGANVVLALKKGSHNG